MRSIPTPASCGLIAAREACEQTKEMDAHALKQRAVAYWLRVAEANRGHLYKPYTVLKDQDRDCYGRTTTETPTLVNIATKLLIRPTVLSSFPPLPGFFTDKASRVVNISMPIFPACCGLSTTG